MSSGSSEARRSSCNGSAEPTIRSLPPHSRTTQNSSHETSEFPSNQPHFLKDFKKIVGVWPTHYLKLLHSLNESSDKERSNRFQMEAQMEWYGLLRP